MSWGGGRSHRGYIDDAEDDDDGRPFLPPPIQDQVHRIDAEIADVNAQVKELQGLKRTLEAERKRIIQEATSTSANTLVASSHNVGGTDYTQNTFPWSRELLSRAKKTWGIANWRHCQEGVVNAVLDGRDAVCIMPTGGGKSLCYQLPAIMTPGVTVVVSPLISLSTDQCFHLREAGIPCEFMSSALSKDDANDILKRVRNTGQQRDGDEEISILFVTPERIAKSKTLMSVLQKAYERGRLARVVIDEAHCCSNQGHDFRPDYRKLSILRKLFPDTKTTCLTATCSPSVLKDVLSTLGMPTITEPTCAWPNRTVYFTAPLHRPNLMYSVLTRPSGTSAVYQSICDWITERHDGETGIVYCLSKKDTETMAGQLTHLSNGAIKADCYHADVDDAQKHRIHVRWREGKIRVVCATIAFGMGIDKPDVRFVLHSGISKSLEGYYQESGRAGRDGKRSDCLLLYRPQDASRVAGLVASEPAGREKLAAMLEYSQSARCRKLIFRDYFEDSLQGDQPCGQCDNCLEPPRSQDVSFYAWQIVNALQEMYDNGGRITVSALADLVRGLKGGQYNVVANGGGGGKRKRSSSSGGAAILKMDLYGGKITDLSSDDIERVIIALLNKQYLADDYNATAYSVNVYVCPGRQAIRLTRLDKEAAGRLSKIIEVNVSSSSKKKKDTKGKRTKQEKSKRPNGKNRGQGTSQSDDSDSEDVDAEEDNDLRAPLVAMRRKSLSVKKVTAHATSGASTSTSKKKKTLACRPGHETDDDDDDVFDNDDIIDSEEERAMLEAEMGDFVVADDAQEDDQDESDEQRVEVNGYGYAGDGRGVNGVSRRHILPIEKGQLMDKANVKKRPSFFERKVLLEEEEGGGVEEEDVELDEDGWQVMTPSLRGGSGGRSSKSDKNYAARSTRYTGDEGGGGGSSFCSGSGSGFKDEPILID